jgi:hypothetical protein
MQKIKTPIIPITQTFVKIKDQQHELDYKAICIYTALGFFLDTDTYWKNEKVLPPATVNIIDDNGFWVSSNPWFTWYYQPEKTNLEETVAKFSELFEGIVKRQSKGKNVILPLSGGLDSRSQAVALKKIGAKVRSYSYSFENGYQESSISKKIAKKCNFNFKEFTVTKSYLWSKLNDLSKINQCYSEFTHPRQMSVIEEIAVLGDSFSLGHWGDVLFDSTTYSQNLSDQELLKIIKNSVLKKGGVELANSLWNSWDLDGDFEGYLDNRMSTLLKKIKITNTNAKIRAFKSLYWAPRWTSVNLSVFESKHEINLPYYDNEMCEFICKIPEDILADRKIQIEYIKNTNTSVAKVVWQDAKPFNLYNSHLAKFPYNFPYRVINKSKRILEEFLGKKLVQRNWELQFLGKDNKEKLASNLFTKEFNQFVDKSVVDKFYDLFYQKDQVHYSHSVSMLLTLSIFLKKSTNE